MKDFVIAPSILAANIACLGSEAERVLAAGADWLHIDVMDNHYVPNLSFGPMLVRALRAHGVRAPIDVHLMARPVDRLIRESAAAGAELISFHPEASEHVHRSVQLILDQGCRAGLVLNPATPPEVLEYVLDKLDLVLVMSVNPGFGGQSFLMRMLDKLRTVRRMLDQAGSKARLQVDGGVKEDNIGQAAAAGADVFVVGTALFGAPGSDYRAAIAGLRRVLASAPVI